MKLRPAITAILYGTAIAICAQGRTPDVPSYEHDIAPLLKTRCVRCHGPATTNAKLNLALPTGVVRGGEHGRVILPNDLEKSPLWQRVATDEMPEDEPLPTEEKDLLRRWIAAGAPGLPAGVPEHPNGDEHWAFQALQPISPPAVRNRGRIHTPVDSFVIQKLEAAWLWLNTEADRSTLIRRVAFDLTGLPPTVSELVAFLSDSSDHAYERMVDRYLASPRYGERWGKFWLDAAGYADSNGYFNADTDRPHAYRYRDYVVRSFNADKPWDQFVREQLAGDELAGYKPGAEVTPSMIELLEATHFLRNSPDGTDSSDGNPDEIRTDKYAVLEGTAQIIGTSLLGLTVQCSKCHDHKFEPFTQQDYYALQAILYPAFNVENWVKPKQREVIAASATEIAAWDAKARLIDEQIAKLREQNKSDVEDEVHKFEAQKPQPLPRIAPVYDLSPTAPDVFVLARGNFNSPLEKAAVAAPHALSDATHNVPTILASTADNKTSTGRRLAFARWLTEPNSRASSLLARVTVNRIWQQHFGTGIVATVENLGYSGSPPTHPELLDYLAAEFIRSGWSTKAIHRVILNSATYRQASRFSLATTGRAVAEVDPDNHLLAHFPLRRLDAEAVRDGMLATSGELDFTAAGPYVPIMVSDEGAVVVDEVTPGAHRRSIYLQQRRTQVAGMLQVFDAPSIVFSCPVRTPTTVPLQALNLLNSPFVRKRAQALAKRVAAAAGGDTDERIRQAFLITVSRSPSSAELTAARDFLDQPRHQDSNPFNASEQSWTDLCQALLASNTFLYVE
ncbi:MAG: PSD1 and planctomycete cytochrome C domain-containing protein [Pirellulales bacterium]